MSRTSGRRLSVMTEMLEQGSRESSPAIRVPFIGENRSATNDTRGGTEESALASIGEYIATI